MLTQHSECCIGEWGGVLREGIIFCKKMFLSLLVNGLIF